MDVVGIREALQKQPFEPFQMRLADGRHLAVPHPDWVAVSPRRIVVVTEEGSWSVVEPLLIVSRDYAKPKRRGGNGKGSRESRLRLSPSRAPLLAS